MEGFMDLLLLSRLLSVHTRHILHLCKSNQGYVNLKGKIFVHYKQN